MNLKIWLSSVYGKIQLFWVIVFLATGWFTGWLVAGEILIIHDPKSIKPWIGVGMLITFCTICLSPQRKDGAYMYSFFPLSALISFAYYFLPGAPATSDGSLALLQGFGIAILSAILTFALAKTYSSYRQDG